MASRAEEKEARRQARLEQEEAERRAAARRKRLAIVGGAVAAAAVVVLAVVLLTGGSNHSADKGNVRQASENGVKLPAQQLTNVDEAAKAAGCTLQHPADEGRGHENRTFTAADYKTNPPTSGTHFPQWAQDGIYNPGDEPQLGELVHTLEHGRIDIQYAPSASPQLRSQLEALAGENGGYHIVLFRNDTKMPYLVAATAWDQLIGCKTVNDKTWDALRTFRDRYIDKAPEKVP